MPERAFTAADVAEHSSPNDCWVVINGKVYDVTAFAKEHPGGPGLIYSHAGKDATDDFEGMHPDTYLASYLPPPLGFLGAAQPADAPPPQVAAEADEPPAAAEPAPPAPPAADTGAAAAAATAPPQVEVPPEEAVAAEAEAEAEAQEEAGAAELPASVTSSEEAEAAAALRQVEAEAPRPARLVLVPRPYGRQGCRWYKTPKHHPSQEPAEPTLGELSLTLCDRQQISHDSYNFHFKASGSVQLDAAQHVYIRRDGVERPYTPVRVLRADEGNTTDLMFVIKVYEHGALSNILKVAQKGEVFQAAVRPMLRFRYAESGWWWCEGKPAHVRGICMIAGGTGITPMYSVIQTVLSNPFDVTTLHLLYASRSPADILLRNELDHLSRAFPDRLRVWYTVDACPPEDRAAWGYSTGYITAKTLGFLPTTDKDLTLVCGPPPMMGSVKKLLAASDVASPIITL